MELKAERPYLLASRIAGEYRASTTPFHLLGLDLVITHLQASVRMVDR
jgi:hypothetical protein